MEKVQNVPAVVAQQKRFSAANVALLISLFLVNKFYIKFNDKDDEIKFDIYNTIEGVTTKLQFKIVKGVTLTMGIYSIEIAKIKIEAIRPDFFMEDIEKLFANQVEKDNKQTALMEKVDQVDPKALEEFLKKNTKS